MLAVSRNPANLKLLAETMMEVGGEVTALSELPDEGELARLVEGSSIALVDIDGFGEEVWGLCDSFVEADRPVIVVTRVRDERLQEAAVYHRVTTVLEKPLNRSNLKAMVSTLAS